MSVAEKLCNSLEFPQTWKRFSEKNFHVEVVVVEIDYFKNNFTQFDSFKD